MPKGREIMSQIHDTVTTFLEGGPFAAKAATVGVVVVASALWNAVTSILAVILAFLFLADLILGVLKSLDRGDDFSWWRFTRAWIKGAAAVVGIALFTLLDLLFQEIGLPPDWYPMAIAATGGMCWGFGVSAAKSWLHFFPEGRGWLSRRLHQLAGEGHVQGQAGERRAPPPREKGP